MKLLAVFAPPAVPQRPRRRTWFDLHLDLLGAAPPPPVGDEDGDETPAACGWFDSSWSLRAGLQITEHASVDPVANDLPLGWWLDGPGAATTSQRG